MSKKELFITNTDISEEAWDKLSSCSSLKKLRSMLDDLLLERLLPDEEVMKVKKASNRPSTGGEDTVSLQRRERNIFGKLMKQPLSPNPYQSWKREPQFRILSDFHYHNFLWARKRQKEVPQFESVKASTFLSLMKLTLYSAIMDKHTLEQSFDSFKARLLKHSIHRPPFSVGVFTYSDVAAINQYATEGMFRMFSLYQSAFTSLLQLSVHSQLRSLLPPNPTYQEIIKGEEAYDFEEDLGGTGALPSASAMMRASCGPGYAHRLSEVVEKYTLQIVEAVNRERETRGADREGEGER